LCDSTSGAFTITLPTAVGATGKKYLIKKTNSQFNNVTIDANGTQTIDGTLTRLLTTQNEAYNIVSDGANWRVLDHHIDGQINVYTPTFTGFGTVSDVEFVWWRQGKNIHVRGKFTSGTPTAVIAAVSMPSGINSEGSPIIPSITIAGTYVNEAGGAALGNKGGMTLITPTVNNINFGDINTFGGGTSNTTLTAKLATTLVSSGDDIALNFVTQVQFWEG
jgi:hypothetical protein